jgi:hypothetical protein
MAAVELLDPAETAPFEPGRFVLIWGSGAYRKSNPFLARVPAARIEDRSALRFYAGEESEGHARWSAHEADAVPLFQQPQLGEFSVAWMEPVHCWVMLYNAANPRGITMRTAARPRGPWSAGQIIFDPWRDHAYGKYMHASGEPKSGPPDHLSEPGRENEWGGEYGPYLIPRFTRGDDHHCRICYMLSTWNPYQAVLMESEIGIEDKK